jgi:two-component system chemotaxis response regulator CheB
MIDAVVIGASAGGLTALEVLLPCLPVHYHLPVIIVQHSHPGSDDFLTRYLNNKCRLIVKQADDKEPVLPGVVYFAPPNYHLLIEMDHSFSLSVEEPVNFARPSIDVLFETAAEAYGSRLMGIILTGASADGARGLMKIKSAGGIAVVQDPRTAEAQIMPKSAISAGEVDFILPLEAIGKFLARLSDGVML